MFLRSVGIHLRVLPWEPKISYTSMCSNCFPGNWRWVILWNATVRPQKQTSGQRFYGIRNQRQNTEYWGWKITKPQKVIYLQCQFLIMRWSPQICCCNGPRNLLNRLCPYHIILLTVLFYITETELCKSISSLFHDLEFRFPLYTLPTVSKNPFALPIHLYLKAGKVLQILNSEARS
jgi:hypothetical protein